MSISESVNRIVEELIPKYGKREATNIVSILMEDKYGITNLNRADEMPDQDTMEDDLKRLLAGEPVQHLTGVGHFYGRKFRVNQHVLIPRPETEELVNQVLQDHQGSNKQVNVLDIGTGSGCIPITLQLERPRWRSFGIDFSLDALNTAKINARNLNAKVDFSYYNFLEKEDWKLLGQFDLLISNPPYISEAEKSVVADNVLLYEPEMALFAGEDPLIFYKAILEFAEDHLSEGGRVYLELNQFNAPDVLLLYKEAKFKAEIIKDMQGEDRVLAATQK